MKLMVRVAGHWTTGIEDWQGTAMQRALREGWEREGYRTRLEAMAKEAA